MTYNPIYFITAASLASNVVTLTVSGNPNVVAKNVVKFLFAPNVQVPSGAVPTDTVQLSINGTAYPLNDKFGMPMTISEIQTIIASISGVATTLFATRKPMICGIGEETDAPFFIAWNIPQPKEIIIPIE